MRRAIHFSALFLVSILAAPAAGFDYINGTVLRVSDGDTIRVKDGGQVYRIRFYGVDTPELAQPYGPRAQKFTEGLVLGKHVTIKVKETDRYGRKVGEVIVGGRSVNRELIRAGFGWWYRDFAAKDLDMKQLEAAARATKRGLWKQAEPVPPWEWRRRD